MQSRPTTLPSHSTTLNLFLPREVLRKPLIRQDKEDTLYISFSRPERLVCVCMYAYKIAHAPRNPALSS